MGFKPLLLMTILSDACNRCALITHQLCYWATSTYWTPFNTKRDLWTTPRSKKKINRKRLVMTNQSNIAICRIYIVSIYQLQFFFFIIIRYNSNLWLLILCNSTTWRQYLITLLLVAKNEWLILTISLIYLLICIYVDI